MVKFIDYYIVMQQLLIVSQQLLCFTLNIMHCLSKQP